ncbi:MAG: CD225/dispanin family protein [Candidatus Cryptobacteroides sp.]
MASILPPHKNKLAWAIISTLCCCIPGGIVSIVYACKSNSLYDDARFVQDDDVRREALYLESEKANRTANTWIIVSVVLSLIFWIVYMVLILTGVTIGLLDEFMY